ncbi:hypothetical protein MVES1_000678 [Malassezia vespertilionis]|uniref:Trafficking protein particle complex subunit 13 n=1 Tax=Malassezia vespertilionis TaxID=2020962 RepID=A0A2N1JGZ3_9BASI|nr:uncharacterized protein MVES1_000678 [Malassezia vespertilionis]PKI85807.1 hypothetical protein MVES_000631 [Malassezia vespertilionis]WFD05348.1 hypothetical protein MVES1_000678 [Malassezia vespertilionis]
MDGPAYVPPLSVKVMRMSTPSLGTLPVPMFETQGESCFDLGPASAVAPFPAAQWDAVKDSYARGSDAPFTYAGQHDDVQKTLRDTMYTDQLTLPSSFGTVCVGETFRALVCICNESDSQLEGVEVHVDMHIGGPDAEQVTVAPQVCRLAQWPENDAPCVLAPRAQITLVVHHELRVLQLHALLCRVCSDIPGAPAAEKAHWISKMYKFPVQPPPIAVRCTTHTATSVAQQLHHDIHVRERTAIQVQLHNVSQKPVIVERIGLDTRPAGETWDWELIEADAGTSSAAQHMQPKDVWQYIFSLIPRQPQLVSHARRAALAGAPEDASPAGHVSEPLGHIMLSWRVPGADPGRLRVGPIMRSVHAPRVCVCGDKDAPALVCTLYMAQAPPPAFVNQAIALSYRLTVSDVAAHAPTRTFSLVLVQREERAWDATALLGHTSTQLPPLTTHTDDSGTSGELPFSLTLLPLRTGIVRGGAMALALLSFSQENYAPVLFDPPHILHEWDNITELYVADDQT